MNKKARVFLSFVLLVVGVSSVVACSTKSATTLHNTQDVQFAANMIPHHGQAVTMANLAESRAQSTQVKELAKQISTAQQPEIDQMNQWLTNWNESKVDPFAVVDHSEHKSMPGMMTSAQLKSLGDARGSAFDRLFLELMIEHHKGAIEMAKTEKSKGKDPTALKLADSIVITQQAEITAMERLHKELR